MSDKPQQVWIVESGDYEARGIVGVFASSDLAAAYIATFLTGEDESPTSYRLWDRPPMAVRYFAIQGLFSVDGDPGWDAPRRESFATDEVHCDWPAKTSVQWWRGNNRPSAVFVQARGNDQAAVESAFSAEWEAVAQGKRPA